jgi:hypothetical protein
MVSINPELTKKPVKNIKTLLKLISIFLYIFLIFCEDNWKILRVLLTLDLHINWIVIQLYSLRDWFVKIPKIQSMKFQPDTRR